MKIEIWSDVVCPFCYIGKRKLEKSLAQMPFADQVQIEWKSFQLNPDQKTDPSVSTLEHLAQSKGWSMDQTRQITENVMEMAKAEGLDFDFEKAVVANTRNAHRLIHLAKKSGKGNEMKEHLLSAYFSEGKNVDDFDTLVELGIAIGLDSKSIITMLESSAFDQEVDEDIYESRQIGVRGVPFFVLDRKYGISGAQPDQVFNESLTKAWAEYQKANPSLEILSSQNGDACDIDGDC
ncbi:DsbA family protein [Algoriphagus namhaensis]|uniref:DsbA family protein n=1 Tax=Algoriphagus namhaensis TaxID=915353 RepID=A0ABV8AT44_9BACT